MSFRDHCILEVHDVLDFASNLGNCPKKKKWFLGICYGAFCEYLEGEKQMIIRQLKGNSNTGGGHC